MTSQQKITASERLFLDDSDRYFEEMKEVMQGFVLRQHSILPIPAYFRYGRKSINQRLWELLPELLKLISDDNPTSTEHEIQVQYLAKELSKWLACRCVYNTADEPPVAPLDISDAVASAIASTSHIEQLLLDTRQENSSENGNTTALAKSKR